MQKQDITTKNIGKVKVLSKREKGTYEKTISKLIDDLMSVIFNPMNQGKVQISGPIMMIMHDDEYKEVDADIEIAAPISGEIVITDPSVIVRELPEMKVISAIHKGSYGEVGPTYDKLFKYVSENNLKISGRMRELYLNNPQEVKEEDLLTEVQLPIE